MPVTAQPRAKTKERLDPAVRKMLVIVVVGIIAPLLDTTIVNVAIDTLGRDLHTTVSGIQWVNTAYLLAMGMVIPPSGWAVARFGAKRMWLGALGVFLVGSVLAGACWGIGALIVSRVVQGVGGGLLFTLMQTIIVQAAGGRRLGRLMAMVGLPAVLVPILGPVAGGLIIANLSWRWIFYINIPISAVAILFAWRGMPADKPREPRRLDVLGLVLLSPALAALLYGLSQAGAHGGFGAPSVWVSLSIGVVLTAAFAVHAVRLRSAAAVDLRLFRIRSFSAAGTLLFLSGLSLYGAMFLLPLYYQQLRGLNALDTGLLLAPQGLGSLMARGPAGSLVDRIGSRPVAIGGVMLAVIGTVAFAVAGPGTNEVLLAISLVVRGAGLSGATVAVMAAAFVGLQPDQIPHASSATRIMQQVGGAFGTAVLAAILQQSLLTASTAAARTDAFQTAFWWSLGFTALAVVPALFLPSMGSRSKREQPDPAPAERDRALTIKRG